MLTLLFVTLWRKTKKRPPCMYPHYSHTLLQAQGPEALRQARGREELHEVRRPHQRRLHPGRGRGQDDRVHPELQV